MATFLLLQYRLFILITNYYITIVRCTTRGDDRTAFGADPVCSVCGRRTTVTMDRVMLCYYVSRLDISTLGVPSPDAGLKRPHVRRSRLCGLKPGIIDGNRTNVLADVGIIRLYLYVGRYTYYT